MTAEETIFVHCDENHFQKGEIPLAFCEKSLYNGIIF